MANNVRNVVAGRPMASGGVWRGPLGTPLPEDETTALDSALRPAGYIGEDGLSETQDRSTEKIRAWGGNTVKVVQTEFGLTYQFTFIESVNGDVLRAVYGPDNVATTAATKDSGTKHAVTVTADQLPHEVYVFDVMDGDARIRIAVPDGQITEVGDITYADGEVVGYQVTVEAFPSDIIDGGNAVKYINDGQKAPGTSARVLRAS